MSTDKIIRDRINALDQLGDELRTESTELSAIIDKAHRKNKWFTPDYIRLAISNLAEHFLSKDNLEEWMGKYDIPQDVDGKMTLGIIMAGNLPLVGLHDFLCAYILGFKQQIKLSSKDEVLLPYIVSRLSNYDPGLSDGISFIDRLKDFDCVIATGSNNSNRYFEYYFKDKPKILRKNRHSAAILNGRETESQVEHLADDVFSYFGLGCRNVSKVFLPKGYTVEGLLEGFEKYKWTFDHTPYHNNYEYNRTLLLMNNTPHLANDFIMLVENKQLSSPLASLNYEFYADADDLKSKLSEHKDDLQCLIGNDVGDIETIAFGQSQRPELWDYADGVDVVEWLLPIINDE